MDEQRSEERKKMFKRSTFEELGRKREDYAIKLRKKKKDDLIREKRMKAHDDNESPTKKSQEREKVLGSINTALVDPNTPLEEKLEIMKGTLTDCIRHLMSGSESVDQNTNSTVIYYIVQMIRKYLSKEENPPIDQIVKMGFVPLFINLLNYKQSSILTEAAWALTNISASNSEHVAVVVKNEALPKLVRLLRTDDLALKEQALWAVGNIVGDGVCARDLSFQTDLTDALLTMVSQRQIKVSLLRTACWTISNLCRGKPDPPFKKVEAFIPYLINLIYVSDEEVLSDCLWALSYISDGEKDHLNAIMSQLRLDRVIELMNYSNYTIKVPALRIIGNILTGPPNMVDLVLEKDGLKNLVSLLYCKHVSVQKEACWALSNITAGPPRHLEHFLSANAVPILLKLVKDAEFSVKKEAAWVFSNACSEGTDVQISKLVELGVLKALTELMNYDDPQLLCVVLEGIDHILQIGNTSDDENQLAIQFDELGGVTRLESLQLHSNAEIYNKVVAMLDKYYTIQETGDVHQNNDETNGFRSETKYNF